MNPEQTAPRILQRAPEEAKKDIATHEQKTSDVLNQAQALITRYGTLKAHLSKVTEQSKALQPARPQSRIALVLQRITGEADTLAALRVQLQGKGSAIAQEMHAVHQTLRTRDYQAIETRTQEHYSDLRVLTVLEINGDPEADAYRARTSKAISALRHAQRAIEEALHSQIAVLVAGKMVGGTGPQHFICVNP